MNAAHTSSPSTTVRNRVKEHRRVRAGDLVPHELNYRLHPEHQRAALGAIYREIGFARSLLAYELPGGKLKLIDGHLRRDMDPDMEVDVEILDVNDEEARALLLSIDPLADLALVQDQIHQRLLELTPTDCAQLQEFWKEAEATMNQAFEEDVKKEKMTADDLEPRFLVLIDCPDEQHQVELLRRLQGEGLDCKAVVGYGNRLVSLSYSPFAGQLRHESRVSGRGQPLAQCGEQALAVALQEGVRVEPEAWKDFGADDAISACG